MKDNSILIDANEYFNKSKLEDNKKIELLKKENRRLIQDKLSIENSIDGLERMNVIHEKRLDESKKALDLSQEQCARLGAELKNIKSATLEQKPLSEGDIVEGIIKMDLSRQVEVVSKISDLISHNIKLSIVEIKTDLEFNERCLEILNNNLSHVSK